MKKLNDISHRARAEWLGYLKWMMETDEIKPSMTISEIRKLIDSSLRAGD